MKRILFICMLVIIFSLNFTVQAKDEKLLEEHWDGFITTTELEYLPEEGEIELELISTKYHTDYKKVIYGYTGGYGLESIELIGDFTGISSFDSGFEYLDTGVEFKGSVKARLFDQNGFQLAVKASTDGRINLWNEGFIYDLDFYSEKAIGDNLTLHNNFSCGFVDTTFGKRLYNGLSYRYNQHHALKAYLYTGFIEFDSLINSLNLMYRNDFYDQVTLLSYFTITEDNLLFGNKVEIIPISDLIVTGYYEFMTEKNDLVGIDLRKDLTNYRLNGSYHFSKGQSLLSGGIAYDLSSDMQLKLEFDRYLLKHDDNCYDRVEVRSVVTYSI